MTRALLPDSSMLDGTETDRLAPADVEVDRQLAYLSSTFGFLTLLSPVNAADAKAAYLATGADPTFVYPELDVTPEQIHAELDRVDVSQVQDPAVRTLLTSKHRELALQADMLGARGTEDFLPLSIELFGGITPRLREQAEKLLAWVPEQAEPRPAMGAEEFLALALAEIDHYRTQDPSLTMRAQIDPEAAGVMVSGDTLLVPPTVAVDEVRANALIQHEVGTHLVTRANGAAQPLKCLGVGLAGYDETQEGLAVLAEIGCGGLTAPRLRTLAARVLTVHRMVDGADFHACHAALVEAGIGRGSAFTTVMRVFRSGGFTKDAIYLRGLVDLLDRVAAGGSLEPLWLGKMALPDLPLVEDLAARGVLEPPRVRPHYLDDPQAQRRIERAANADSLTDIFQKENAA